MPDAPHVPGEPTALRAANGRLRHLLGERDAQIAELRELVTALQAQVAELTARVQANSKNSSRPPPSDGLGKPAPKSLRTKAGRRPGRPKGQPGKTLELADRPDRLIRYEPGRCAGCGAGLSGAEQAGIERRQVIDVPPVRPEVTEHQVIARRCGCGTVTCGQVPDGVTAPVQYGRPAQKKPGTGHAAPASSLAPTAASRNKPSRHTTRPTPTARTEPHPRPGAKYRNAPQRKRNQQPHLSGYLPVALCTI